ncbi:MAG: protein phosphatase CheZ [Candidatus Manganitrophus sp. SA1]|nr:protein phosphatase CheZ [Candidatus Manganitrophus morganii]
MDFHESSLEDNNIRGLIRAARGIIEGDLKKEVDQKLSDELGKLAKYLQAISRKLQAAESDIETASSQIPYGTDQIHGVTRFTEEEVHRVLGIVEKVIESHDALANKWESLKTHSQAEMLQRPTLKRQADEIGSTLRDEKKMLMDLMTALSFQDVAAQWLKKISSDMTNVQSRIKRLNSSLNVKGKESGPPTSAKETDRDANLMKTGNRFAGADKMGQTDVDHLLKEYGL